MDKKIVTNIKEYILDNFMLSEDEVKLDTTLIESGLVDSMGIIEIVSFIEEEYEIVIEDEELNRENFDTIIKIAEFIEKKINIH